MPIEYAAANWVGFAKRVLIALAVASLLWSVSIIVAYAVCLGSTPTFEVSYPVHFDFTPSYGLHLPSANVTLSHRVVIDNQPYSFKLDLLMPETSRNIAIGTLTASIRIVSKSGVDVAKSQFSVRFSIPSEMRGVDLRADSVSFNSPTHTHTDCHSVQALAREDNRWIRSVAPSAVWIRVRSSPDFDADLG